jgi:hypothetical protein
MASIKHANAFDFTNPVPGFLLIDAPQKLDEPQDNIELQPILLDVPGMAIFKIPHLQYLNSNILKIILDY